MQSCRQTGVLPERPYGHPVPSNEKGRQRSVRIREGRTTVPRRNGTQPSERSRT